MAPAPNSLIRSERISLAHAFTEAGEKQATLCQGWNTKDLLVHLIVRERRPDAAAGIVLPFLKPWREKVERELASGTYEELIETFKSGPGSFSPFALPGVDNVANLIEFVIHHEDVRRAQPNWQPRTETAELQLEIKRRLPKFSMLALRRSPVGVVMLDSTGQQIWLKRGNTTVELHGEPVEVLLYLSGRQQHAQVSIHGSPAAIATFERVKFGF
jgi:uncharacterized protein (TIGR03085 family)